MLKNRTTNEPLLVIIFTLLPKDGEEKADEPAESKQEENDDLD